MTAIGDATSLGTRKRLAGQRLVIGFDGTDVTPELRELVREVQPAGFILFKRNVLDPAQVRDLNRSLAELLPSDRPALLSVDQEGGRVQRMRAPATEWPAMRLVGRAGDLTAKVGTALGREVRAMGFNVNFAPVADVDSNPANPVIGDRSFSRHPGEVAQHVVDFAAALQATGVLACAKHFPGHGDTDVDSHLDLPVVNRPIAELEAVELAPFQVAAAAGVAAIMSAHIVFPGWDPDWPATLSETILSGILRDRLGHRGLLFTDDLEMKAISGRYGAALTARRTFLATVDLMLACHQADLQLELFEAMVRLQEESRLIEQRARESQVRLDAARSLLARAPAAPDLDVVGCAEHVDLAARVREAASRTLA